MIISFSDSHPTPSTDHVNVQFVILLFLFSKPNRSQDFNPGHLLEIEIKCKLKITLLGWIQTLLGLTFDYFGVCRLQ